MSFTKPTLDDADWAVPFGRLIDLAEGPARRNFVRNGDFQFARRGTSFAGLTTDQYTLEGWIAGAGGTNTVSQQSFTVGQTDVPGNPRNYLRVVRSGAAAADNTICSHRIEHPDRLAGRTVTVGFWAKVATGTKALVLDFNSSGVTSAVDTSDEAITVSSNWAYYEKTITLPTMTAVTAAAYLALRIREAASFATFTFDLADVQVEIGSEGTLFERLEYGDAMRWQQRFLNMSFKAGTAPAQNAGGGTGEILFTAGKAGAANQYATVRYPVAMRATPATITYYSPSAASAQVYDADAAAGCTATATALSTEDGFSLSCTGNASTAVGNQLKFHYLATAEL